MHINHIALAGKAATCRPPAHLTQHPVSPHRRHVLLHQQALLRAAPLHRLCLLSIIRRCAQFHVLVQPRTSLSRLARLLRVCPLSHPAPRTQRNAPHPGSRRPAHALILHLMYACSVNNKGNITHNNLLSALKIKDQKTNLPPSP